MSVRADYDKIVAFLLANNAKIKSKCEIGLTVTARITLQLIKRMQNELILEYPFSHGKEPKRLF
ncbi:hypothetical protein IT399_02810 [Candidatus Nomurabacteria bacterium]|nr:hypothetical protein [Candidatus Nomurabacteria bacterium]